MNMIKYRISGEHIFECAKERNYRSETSGIFRRSGQPPLNTCHHTRRPVVPLPSAHILDLTIFRELRNQMSRAQPCQILELMTEQRPDTLVLLMIGLLNRSVFS